jgi:hypothetical protein
LIIKNNYFSSLDTINHITSLESDVLKTQGLLLFRKFLTKFIYAILLVCLDADTNEQSPVIPLTTKSKQVPGESLESLSVPPCPDLLPLATMPDQITHRAVQEVLLASLESTKVTHIEDTTEITSTTWPILPDKPSTLTISKDHDEFFDVESEFISEITKTDVTPLISSEKPSITLAEAEKLQHNIANEQKDDEFYEPELDLVLTKSKKDRLTLLPLTANKKDEAENGQDQAKASNTLLSLDKQDQTKHIPVESPKTTDDQQTTTEKKPKPVNKKKPIVLQTPMEKNEDPATVQKATSAEKSKSINKRKTTELSSNTPATPTKLTASVDKKDEEECVDQVVQQISCESEKSASSDIESKKIDEVQFSSKLSVSPKESPHIETVEIFSPESQIPPEKQELLRPKFSLRLKPMIAVNDGDYLKFEVHFIAQPEPIVRKSFHILAYHLITSFSTDNMVF